MRLATRIGAGELPSNSHQPPNFSIPKTAVANPHAYSRLGLTDARCGLLTPYPRCYLSRQVSSIASVKGKQLSSSNASRGVTASTAAGGVVPACPRQSRVRVNSTSANGSPTSTASSAEGGTPFDEPWDCHGEECLSPLRVALQVAQERLDAVTSKREELEQAAQEVAQAAVEAARAHEEAERLVDAISANLGTVVQLQQSLVAKIAEMSKNATEEADHAQIEMANAELESLKAQIKALQVELESARSASLKRREVAGNAEEVAASAMKVAEAAVKEEIQAQAVVHETQEAIIKTLESQAADDSIQSVLPESIPAVSSVVNAEKGAGEVDAAATMADPRVASLLSPQAPTLAEPLKEGAAGADKKGTGGLLLASVAAVAVAAASWYLLQHTDKGQALMAAAGSAADYVKDKLGVIHVHEGEKSLLEAICLLMTSCICVPLVVSKIPGGNPVLGYLLGGALVGPYSLGIIQDVHTVQHIAELGVVFLLFNIGLELSLDRLRSMAKQVFGMGSLQVILTMVGVAFVANSLAGLPIPSGIILGGALAMSSTAIGIQVLEDRGEMGSRHGRGIFSVLLFQDLAVVLLLMLIPLLAPGPDGSMGGMGAIAKALGMAALKAVACVICIIAGGRLIIRPLYRIISEFANSELLSSLTLLVCLGTSFLTSLAGLSLALGAFLAGLLIAETEFAMQVESDIAPYKGLLLGLFFMVVGMEISAGLFIERWKEVLGGMVLLIGGKLAVITAVGPMFGMTKLSALRAGLLLSPGGEFAFVAFGEAVAKGALPAGLTSVLYLVVALTMACIPYLAMLGGKIGALMESNSTKNAMPKESETKELNNHVIIAGYGRSGQLIAQLLSENHIPFVAVTTHTDCVAKGQALDLPVYFGDPGSPSVMHHLGAERAACAVIALNTPGANYRVVWSLKKHYPNVKTFVRAHDLVAAVNLEKAGATAVVPETLEPSLQLVAAALSTMTFNNDDVRSIIDEYRRKHTAELSALTKESGTTIGYHGISPEGKEVEMAVSAALAGPGAAANTTAAATAASSGTPALA